MSQTDHLSAADLEDLKRARSLLESGGLVVRVAETLGRPLEAGLERLPARARDVIHGATQTALNRGLEVALGTLAGRRRRSSERLHKAAAATAGAVGGFFGLGGLPGMYFGAKVQKFIYEKWIKLVLGIIVLMIGSRYILRFFL